MNPPPSADKSTTERNRFVRFFLVGGAALLSTS